MFSRTLKTLQPLPAAFLLFSAAIFNCASGWAQTNPPSPELSNRKQNNRPGQSSAAPEITEDSKTVTAPVTYSYEFSQPAFYVRHIVIEHDASGRGSGTDWIITLGPESIDGIVAVVEIFGICGKLPGRKTVSSPGHYANRYGPGCPKTDGRV